MLSGSIYEAIYENLIRYNILVIGFRNVYVYIMDNIIFELFLKNY